MRVSFWNLCMDNIYYEKHLFLNNIYQKDMICSFELLKIFWNIQDTSRKKSTVKSSRPQVFSKIGVLKKFAKSPRTLQCWSHFLVKCPDIKILQHKSFFVNFAKLSRTLFSQNTFQRLLLQVEVCLKVTHCRRSQKCFSIPSNK